MNLHSLKPAIGSVKNSKRIGRGPGSRGGTSTKGHNGAQSRSGYKSKFKSEGGQNPLQMRIPKFGFNNPNRITHKGINLFLLQNLVDSKNITTFSIQTFIDNGIIGKNKLIKILNSGELKAKIDVSAHSISKTAKKAIEDLGGKVTIISNKK